MTARRRVDLACGILGALLPAVVWVGFAAETVWPLLTWAVAVIPVTVADARLRRSGQ